MPNITNKQRKELMRWFYNAKHCAARVDGDPEGDFNFQCDGQV